MRTPEKTARKQAAGKNSGQWRPGQSGNAKGRPKGSGQVGKLRAAIADNLPAVIRSMLARALNGDAAAARLLLERCVPSLKPTEAPVSLTMPADQGLTAQGRAVFSAVADGTLTPSQGAALLSGLGALARVRELDELEARLARLEAEANDGP